MANEKAENINKQRSAIRALGRERLMELIHRIFDGIGCEGHNDVTVARDFGLSKATLSRFAGSRWRDVKKAIPDLWLNTAHVLATNPVFREVVEQTGVWDQIKATLENQKTEGEYHA